MLYNRCTGIYKFGNNTYPQRLRCRSNLGYIFREKKCFLWAGKYGNNFYVTSQLLYWKKCTIKVISSALTTSVTATNTNGAWRFSCFKSACCSLVHDVSGWDSLSESNSTLTKSITCFKTVLLILVNATNSHYLKQVSRLLCWCSSVKKCYIHIIRILYPLFNQNML